MSSTIARQGNGWRSLVFITCRCVDKLAEPWARWVAAEKVCCLPAP